MTVSLKKYKLIDDMKIVSDPEMICGVNSLKQFISPALRFPKCGLHFFYVILKLLLRYREICSDFDNFFG